MNRESSECSECLHQAGDVQCPPGDDDKDEAGGDIDDNGDMTVMTQMRVVLTLMTTTTTTTTTITGRMTTARKLTRFMAGRPAA